MFKTAMLHLKRFAKESPLVLPIMAFVLGSLIALPVATNAAPSAKTDVSFVSYNILVREYGDRTFPAHPWSKRKTVIINYLKNAKSPVIGLQESRYKDQRTAVRDGLGANWRMTNYTNDAINMRDENAILWDTTKMTLVSNGNETISSGYWMNWVRLQDRASGIKYYVFNTHYDYVESHTLRNAQAKKSLEIINRITKANSKDPVVLMGDLNADTGTPPMRIIADGGFTNSRNATPAPIDNTKTWSGFKKVGNGYKRDHILYKNDSRTKTLSYATDVSAYLGSDHLPVRAKLQFSTATEVKPPVVTPKPEEPSKPTTPEKPTTTPTPTTPEVPTKKPDEPKTPVVTPEKPQEPSKPTTPQPPVVPTPEKPSEPVKPSTPPVQAENNDTQSSNDSSDEDNETAIITELPKTGSGGGTLATMFILGSVAAGVTALLQMRSTPLRRMK